MHKTVAKRSSAILAIALTLILALAGLGLFTTAEAAGAPTLGAFATWDGYTFNGTSENAEENKTVISYNWSTAGTFLTRVNVSNYTETGSFVLSLTADKDATVRLVLLPVNGYSPYGAEVIATGTEMTAGTPYTLTLSLAAWDTDLLDAGAFDLGFYFDMKTADTGAKKITVNTLTVGGASYTPAPYVPVEEVQAPDTSFKELADWSVTNGTTTANDLVKLTGAEAEGKIDNAAGNVEIADTSKSVTVTVPLSETLNNWPTDWTTLYIKHKLTNVAYIEAYIQTVTSDNLFCQDVSGKNANSAGDAWNCSTENSVSEGYRLSTVGLGTFFTGYRGAISQIVLVPKFTDTSAPASIEIGGMTFGNAKPSFINDIGTPALEIAPLATWNACYTLTANSSLTVGQEPNEVTYTGAKLEYTATTQLASLYAQVSNYDYAKYPKLHLGFYTEQDIKLGIWAAVDGEANTCILWHTEYKAGYKTIDMDLASGDLTADKAGKVTGLYLYVDSAEATTKTNTVLFDSIALHKDWQVVTAEATANGPLTLNNTTDGTVSFTCETQTTPIGYYYAAIPVQNWYSFNRFLLLDITLDSPLRLGVNFNTNEDGGLLAHIAYASGRYKFCFDTNYIFGTGACVENGDNFVKIYCDAEGEVTAGTKTVIVNAISFSDKAEYVNSPNATNISLDFAAQSFTVEDGFEVSATADFAALLESGAAITPGTSLYLRGENGPTAATEIALPARPTLQQSDVPAATVGDNFIRWAVSGYEFKMGDGEWNALGSWGNLQPGTAYTVSVRKAATATTFASESVDVIVTTTGTKPTTPGGEDTSTPAPKKRCGSQASASLAFAGVLLLWAAGAVIGLRKKDRA